MDNEERNDDALFNLLEELYALHHRNWKKRILMTIVEKKKASYRPIKDELLEVPDLLVYRCIRELIKEEVVKREEEQHRIYYRLMDEQQYLAHELRE